LEAKYLEADTTLAEERLLGACFSENPADEDEKVIAKLLLLEKGQASDAALAALTSEKGAAEYDSAVRRKQRKDSLRAAATAAFACGMLAAAGLILFRGSQPREQTLSPLEIARSLSTLASMSGDEVESITARPVGDGAVVTVINKNGESSAYILTSDAEDGTLRLLALSNTK